jgi:aspartate/methionine/tyrosine aminotransferase
MAVFCRQLMEKTGTMLVPGSCFQREGYVRMGYACDEQTLINGLEQLSHFLNNIV